MELFLLEYANIVYLHFSRASIEGSHLVDVPDAREVSADRKVQEDEIVLAELVVTEVLESHFEIWFRVRISLEVDVHGDLVLCPYACECMEFSVLNRVLVVDVTCIVLVSRCAPVACTVEEGLLTVVEAV
jgi:hypothetical protein